MSEKEPVKRKISRRAMLATIGAAGAAAVSGGLFKHVNGMSSVTTSVYGAGETDADSILYKYGGSQPERTVGAKLRETVSVKDFGAIGDGIADDTAAIQAAANSLTRGGLLLLPAGTYIISDTIQVPQGLIIQGAGLHSVVIHMNDSTKFAINVFTPGSRVEYFRITGFTLNAKYGITNRWDVGTDYANAANPSRSVQIADVKFVGTYDARNDTNAQSVLVPTREQLESFGVGLHLVMVYGAEVKSCLFDHYGIALENIGCTLAKVERNRFNGNARHIHDERVLWHSSSFGMGADNVYEQNDLLDATRIGGITLWRSFGAELRHNYSEQLERNGIKSVPEMVYLYNPDSCKIHMNHLNVSLSVAKQRPYFKIVYNGDYIGCASGNVIQMNTLTPFNGVLDNIMEIVTTKWDKRYPWNTQLVAQGLSPIQRLPYVISGIQPEWNVMAYDNLFPQMNLSGTLANRDLPFAENASHRAWHLASGESLNFRFKLYVANPKLSTNFELQVTAEGNSDTAPGNGRAHMAVKDAGGAVLFNSYAFTGVTGLMTASIPLQVTSPESMQLFDIDFTNLSFSKIYRAAVVPVD
ncbi:MAG: hypothetical protein K0Q59_3478 [Paenibacillus sp.]|jgi:hypothetical protein|nr:hypothetical protein [Paenibacillus sp.]